MSWEGLVQQGGVSQNAFDPNVDYSTLPPCPFYNPGKTRTYTTTQLFVEPHRSGPLGVRFRPLFTLQEDVPGYLNARKLFIELDDPTGYLFATKYLAGWAHWEVLIKKKWFSDAVAIWRAELSAILEMKTLNVLRQIAEDPDHKSRFSAAQYLHKASRPAPKSTRGRPTKAEIDAELKKEVDSTSTAAEDAERMGLIVINGGKKTTP